MIPETRSEIFLANIAGEQNELPAPQSRIEHYLNAIAQAGDIHGGSAGAVIYDKDASYPDGSVGAAMQEMDGEISENTSDISQLKSDFNTVFGDNIETLHFIEGGYIDKNDGELISYAGWKHTDYIDLSGITEISTTTDAPNSLDFNAFYDENLNFIEKYILGTTKTVSARYIRLSISSNYTISLAVSPQPYRSIDEKLNVNAMYDYGIEPCIYSITWAGNGYINQNTGAIEPSTTYKHTDFIELNGNKSWLFADSTQEDNPWYNAFYDANKTFVKSFKLNEPAYIPTNAKYFMLSMRKAESVNVHIEEPSTSIINLNKNAEIKLIQSTAKRPTFFNDQYSILSFLHLSDIHAAQDMWNRMVSYLNFNKQYLQFALHTGDYVGQSQEQYVDLYGNETPTAKLPIFNCVGNHDSYVSYPSKELAEQSLVYSRLFSQQATWGVTFMQGENAMAYYKDFTDCNIRLIVLDNYYNQTEQVTWLGNLLTESKDRGLHVITAMHEVSRPIVTKEDTGFQTITPYENVGGNQSVSPFDAVIANFKNSGGVHICNLVGHEHSDMFGYTSTGVLNIAVECATNDRVWSDGKRIAGERCYDCFNVVSIDPNINLLKLVRIGDNVDLYMRPKNMLCFNYVTGDMISTS